MAWFLTIRSDPSYRRTTAADPLLTFLGEQPGLTRRPMEFRGDPGDPWVILTLANCDPSGSYTAGGAHRPVVNIVELICADDGDPEWYESLAGRIASRLGWVAVEGERRVWPPNLL